MNPTFTYDSELTELTNLIGNDAELLQSFIEPFLSELDDYAKAVPENIAAGKQVEVGRAFHSLKVNAKVFGSLSLHSLCKELESEVNSGNLAFAKTHEEAFIYQITSLRDQLQGKLNSL